MCRLFSRKCRHKYGAFVDEDQYQYCIKCGVARQVEIPHKHDWKLIRESEVYLPGEKKETDYPIYSIRIYECLGSSCREIKRVKS